MSQLLGAHCAQKGKAIAELPSFLKGERQPKEEEWTLWIQAALSLCHFLAEGL